MTDNLATMEDPRDSLGGRVAVLEATVAKEAGLRVKMDERLGRLEPALVAQKGSLQALGKTQAEHTQHLRSIDAKLTNLETWAGYFKGETDAIKGRLDRVETRLDRVEGRLGSIETRIGGLEGRFKGLEGRFAGLEGRFAGLEGRFAGLEDRFAGLEGRFKGLEERMGHFEARMNHFEVRLIDMNDRLGKVEEGLRDVKTGMTAILDLLNTHLVRQDEQQHGDDDG